MQNDQKLQEGAPETSLTKGLVSLLETNLSNRFLNFIYPLGSEDYTKAIRAKVTNQKNWFFIEDHLDDTKAPKVFIKEPGIPPTAWMIVGTADNLVDALTKRIGEGLDKKPNPPLGIAIIFPTDAFIDLASGPARRKKEKFEHLTKRIRAISESHELKVELQAFIVPNDKAGLQEGGNQ